MSDLFDEIFVSEVEDTREEFYPGSRHKRRPEPEVALEGDLWREDYTVKTIAGQERRFYTVGALAQALSVSVESIRLWTRKGNIPQAPYRLPVSVVHGQKHLGRRLYTEAMIDAAVRAFAKRGLIEASRISWNQHRDLTVEIHDAWSRIHSEETGNV
jgi:DNA-binding transcriptional MerR regulator